MLYTKRFCAHITKDFTIKVWKNDVPLYVNNVHFLSVVPVKAGSPTVFPPPPSPPSVYIVRLIFALHVSQSTYRGVAVSFIILDLFISPVGSTLSQRNTVRICGQPASLSGLFCSHLTWCRVHKIH